MTKKQEKEFELKMLMNKIQGMINRGERTENGVWIDTFLTNTFLETVNKVIKLYEVEMED